MVMLLLLLLLPPPLRSATLLPPHGHVTVRLPLPSTPFNTSLPVLTITTTATSPSTTGTLLFSAFYGGGLNSWSLELGQGRVVSKALCATREVQRREGSVSVAVFSTSSTEQAVELVAVWVEGEVAEGRELTTTITAGSSQVLYHSPNLTTYNTGESYLLSVTSPTTDCCMVAVSPASCPWPDTASTASQASQWARILTIGYFPIRASDFPSSFTVSLVPLSSSSSCHTATAPLTSRGSAKQVTVRLERVETDYWLPVTLTLAGFLTSSAVTLLLWGLCFRLQLTNNFNRREHRNKTSNEEAVEEVPGTKVQAPGEMELLRVNPEHPQAGANSSQAVLRTKVAMEIQTKTDRNGLLVHRILKDTRKVADFTLAMRSEDSWHRRQRSKVYLYLVPLLAVFYLVPSVQMVFMLERVAREAGGQEQCFRNFGCSRPWGVFQDANHILSNLGYIVFGAAFTLMVRVKSHMLPEDNRPSLDHQGEQGLAQQHSIFYTMGFSMVLQGIFSCVFHVCPSNISLQFDTTMMYVMLILVFVKVYQFRHPDISAKSFPTMYALAVALVLEACSLYILPTAGKLACYALFCLFYLSVLFKTTFDVYYYGTTKGSMGAVARARAGVLREAARSGASCLFPRRFVFALVLVFINLALMVFFILKALKTGPQGLSSPILVICAVNVTAFLVHYVAFKVKEVVASKEDAGYWPTRLVLVLLRCLCVLVALVLAGVAMRFYLDKHQSRNLTAAESRDMNEECSVMDFFDNHDMWHFLSAAALFLTFIFLLSIDDDILSLKRAEIRVF